MGAGEKERFRDLLQEIEAALEAGDEKAYRNCMQRFPSFAAAADYEPVGNLGLRNYNNIFRNDRGNFVAILCGTVPGLPVEKLFGLAGVSQPDAKRPKEPLKVESAKALLDWTEFKLFLRDAKTQQQGLSILNDLITHESPASTQVMEHFVKVSCPQHHIQVFSLAQHFMQGLYGDASLMPKAGETLLKNLALLAPHLRPETLEKAFAKIVHNTKEIQGDGPDAQREEKRLRVILESLSASLVTRGLAALGDQPSAVKTLLIGKQARLAKVALLRSSNEGDTELKFRQLSIDEQVGRLNTHMDSDDIEAFKRDLVMLTGDPKNRMAAEITRNRLAPLILGVIGRDKGAFLQECMNVDIEVLTESRLARAGLIDSHPLKPDVARVMLGSTAFAQKVTVDDPLIPRILEKLLKDKSSEVASVLGPLQRSLARNGKRALLNEAAFDCLFESAQESSGILYDHARSGLVDNYINCLNAGQSIQLARAVLSATAKSDAMTQRHTEIVGSLTHRMSGDEIADLLPFIAANAGLDTLHHIEDVSGHALAPVEVLQACCGLLSAGAHHSKDPITLATVQSLLLAHNSFSEDDVFTAMMTSIHNAKPQHMEELIAYAEQNGLQIINRTSEDGYTPLTAALRVGEETPRLQMANMLVSHGADGRNDRHGNNPLTMMGGDKLKMQGSAAYQVLATVQEKTIGLAFIAKEEQARGAARLGVLREEIELVRGLIAEGLMTQEDGQAVIRAKLMGPGDQPRRLGNSEEAPNPPPVRRITAVPLPTNEPP